MDSNPPPLNGSRNGVYTLGYGSRSVEDVIALLKRNGIECLVDVRTSPYSRYKPEFGREALDSAITAGGIRYVFRGDLLGGRPNDPGCYVDDKVDYDVVRKRDFYVRGIEIVRKAHDQGMRIALFCSEGKPEECHRSKLIGASLTELGIPVVHLDETGTARTQEEIIQRITGGQLGLFGDPSFMSRKRYGEAETDE